MGAHGPAALSVGGAGNVLTLVGMLLAVVGILVLAWLVTRWIAKRGVSGSLGGGGDGRFRVLRQLSLGQGERLVLVQLEDRCLLLGVTPGGITLLRELDEEQSARWLPKDREDGDAPAPPSFWEALQKNLPRRK